jgi:hypothetical protein
LKDCFEANVGCFQKSYRLSDDMVKSVFAIVLEKLSNKKRYFMVDIEIFLKKADI